jgi:DNA modification methylase
VVRVTVEIIRADARHLPLEDASVDLVVTSPPYFALRSYQDGGEHYGGQIGSEPTPAEFLDALLEVTRECVRVLKPSGSMFVNLGDKYVDKSLTGLPWRYALRCIDDLGLILRAEIIWSKPNGLPEAVTDRVRRAHEQWFHFTAQPRYFAAVDEIREQVGRPASRSELVKASGSGLMPGGPANRWNGTNSASTGPNPLGKLPGSVWDVATQPLKVPAEIGIDHFAAFPVAWPLRLIKGWCPPGGVVLDPFGGTGTTALAAHALGRRGISVDLSADYCRLAEWRTSDPKEYAKTVKKSVEVNSPRRTREPDVDACLAADCGDPQVGGGPYPWLCIEHVIAVVRAEQVAA